MRRMLLTCFAAVLITAACVPPISTPGSTSAIQLVSTSSQGGWKYDFYRNTAYPCSVVGYQTFVLATKVGSSPTASKPLWVAMHGGGSGWFDEAGIAQPGIANKIEENVDSLRTRITGGIFNSVRPDVSGFRLLAVSMCSHDIYGGANTTDPNNPFTTPDGKPRTTNGLLATKAAVQYARGLYPTTDFVLHGSSAGSVGAHHVAWALEQQGIPPSGVVADASIINVEANLARRAQGLCTAGEPPAGALAARIHTDITNLANEPDKLVARGALTVPLLHVWNHGDKNSCGNTPMSCPLRDGSVVTMGITDCTHDAMRGVIDGLGAGARSANLPLCVDDLTTVGPCDVHVVTARADLVNTDPASPADYNAAILDWVHARLADP